MTDINNQPTMGEATLREAIAEIIKQAKGVKINSGEGWEGFTYLTDGSTDTDRLERLFSSLLALQLDRLMEQSTAYWVGSENKGQFVDAVPVEAIEALKSELGGK